MKLWHLIIAMPTVVNVILLASTSYTALYSYLLTGHTIWLLPAGTNALFTLFVATIVNGLIAMLVLRIVYDYERSNK